MNTAQSASSVYTDLIDRYFDAWNEPDVARRRALIDATYASDAAYRDPLMTGDGHAGIDAMIGMRCSAWPRPSTRYSPAINRAPSNKATEQASVAQSTARVRIRQSRPFSRRD